VAGGVSACCVVVALGDGDGDGDGDEVEREVAVGRLVDPRAEAGAVPTELPEHAATIITVRSAEMAVRMDVLLMVAAEDRSLSALRRDSW
jgi:hypothetical protein